MGDGSGETDTWVTPRKAERQQREKARMFPSARLNFGIMYFTGCITIYLMRANLSVAVVCMTVDDVINQIGVGTESTNGSILNQTETTTMWNNGTPFLEQGHTGEFHWNRMLRGIMLSAFAIGYTVGQSPIGWLTTKLSSKWLMFAGISFLALLTAITPVAARASPYAVIAVRIGEGLGCSVYYTTASCLFGLWIPPVERSRFNAFTQSGSLWGIVISFALSGYLCRHGFAGGWPSIFYVPAMIATMWLGAWLYLIYDSPAKHPRISLEERVYIMESLNETDVKTPPIPWRSLLCSRPFHAIMVVDYAYSWGWFSLLTSLPQFMHDAFHLEIQNNALVSALPYVISWAVAVTFSILADHLIEWKGWAVATVRKLSTGLGMMIPALLLIMVGFVESSSPAVGVACLTLAVGAMGICRSGHHANIVDIAPRYAGVLVGISNSNVAGFVAPIVNGALVPTGSRREWQYVFILSASLTTVGGIIYCIFGQGTLQPWADVTARLDQEELQEKPLNEKQHETKS